MMSKARNQFPVIELALVSKRSPVKQLIILSFLCLEVQEHALSVGMLEHNLPLRRFGDIDAQSVPRRNVGENVLVVALDIHGQEAETTHVLRRQVVDSTDDSFAFVVSFVRLLLTIETVSQILLPLLLAAPVSERDGSYGEALIIATEN